uniref:NADH-ubiquinone oxidoreductase chain 3 n=2 Tax=unclassified Curculionoidea TaxID=201752 RepID=A0A346RIT9_9CUCU|nr:NADH dehydrogenase subunit 3 [Curculionoidea sp. 6 KM-2017]AXS65996.1 NADH dehydrogenase subunit 3 [Curculionoidea sp. 5 KM-2017]
MKMLFSLAFMMMTILTIMMIMLNLVSKKTFYDREKNSPFECGFDPKNLARLPFSLQFFLIAIIFVIFDVELTLLLPTILITKISNSKSISISLSFFISILIMGVIHEQSQGSLNWAK